MASTPRQEPSFGTHSRQGERDGLAQRLEYLLLELDAVRTLGHELMAGHASSSGPRSVRRLNDLARLHDECILPMIAALESPGGESAIRIQTGPIAWMERSAGLQDENAPLDQQEFERIAAELTVLRKRLLERLSNLGGDALARSIAVAGEGEGTPAMTAHDVLDELSRVDHAVLREVALALNDVKRDAEQAKRTMAGHHPEAT